MPYKGVTNNPFGRPKGSRNRTTQEIREAIQYVIELELKYLQENLSNMPPDKRIDILIRLLNFTLPKLNPINPDPVKRPEQEDEMWMGINQVLAAKRKLDEEKRLASRSRVPTSWKPSTGS